MNEKKWEITFKKRVRNIFCFFVFIILGIVLVYDTFVIARYRLSLSKNDSARVALFDVQLSRHDDSSLNEASLSISGIENPQNIYAFKISNNSEVMVSAEVVICFRDTSNNVAYIDSNNDIDIIITEKDDETKQYVPSNDSTSSELKFNIGNIGIGSSKEYYLKIRCENYNSIKIAQTLHINAVAKLTQVD